MEEKNKYKKKEGENIFSVLRTICEILDSKDEINLKKERKKKVKLQIFVTK